MRVLMLSKACIVGAYQRKLEEMAALAPEMSLTVAVPPFWQDERGKMPLEQAHTEGYDLRVIPMLFNGAFHLHVYPTLGRVMREVQPDIVHIDEEPYNLAAYHAHRLARRHGARALWFSWQNLRRNYPPPFVWMERYNLRRIDYALIGSQTAAQVWRQKGYDGPLAVIPQFGVDPQHFAPPSTPAPDDQPPHIVHIVYVGRLVPEKGVDLLLTALAELGGAWRATILGRGPEAAKLRALTERLGLSERVAFRERVPSVEMPRFYQTADVLVLPSRTRPNWMEQFGRVLIEAMACGVAVVGAESGEIPYVIGDAGLLFPEDDAAALRAALAHLITSSQVRLALGARGRERVLARFTQRQVAQETISVYREMSAS